MNLIAEYGDVFVCYGFDSPPFMQGELDRVRKEFHSSDHTEMVRAFNFCGNRERVHHERDSKRASLRRVRGGISHDRFRQLLAEMPADIERPIRLWDEGPLTHWRVHRGLLPDRAAFRHFSWGVAGIPLGEEDIPALRGIAAHAETYSLDFRGCNFGDEHMGAVMGGLMARDPRDVSCESNYGSDVCALYFARNPITDAGAKILADALLALRFPVELRIDLCALTKNGRLLIVGAMAERRRRGGATSPFAPPSGNSEKNSDDSGENQDQARREWELKYYAERDSLGLIFSPSAYTSKLSGAVVEEEHGSTSAQGVKDDFLSEEDAQEISEAMKKAGVNGPQ